MKVTKTLLLSMVLLMLISLACVAQDYSDALRKAVDFFDANKCGPNVTTNNIFSWRGACHTQDGTDVGVNLNGGFHDAGDHVKFGLPQAYTFSILNWALYEFKDAIDQAGATNKLISQIKWLGDYILRSKTSGRFYYQVGDGQVDHTYWGPPEEQTANRPTYAWADSGRTASCVLGNTAGGLAIAYLNFRDSDPSFASQCLSAARDMYTMGKNNFGPSDGQSFYRSSSQADDLAWAATWLYIIDGTQSYLTEIDYYLQQPNDYGDIPINGNHWTMCWDDMGLAVIAKLAMITGGQAYISVMEDNLNFWMNGINTTPGGLRFLDSWGVLRYASAESMIALLYYGYTGNQAYKNLAQSQLDYILMGNPARMSYVIGYGSNWALHPHHRAANGYTYANGDNQKPAKHELTGALVGGPNQSDSYIDDVNQYQYTEVAIDYNASFVGALAAMINYAGGITTPIPTSTPVNTPVPTATPATTPTTGSLGDVDGNGTMNIIDALLIAQYYVDLDPVNFNPDFADTNCDGNINIIDALCIAQFYVDLIDGFCL